MEKGVKVTVADTDTYNHARHTSNAEMSIPHAVFFSILGPIVYLQVGILLLLFWYYRRFILFENIFLFKYVLTLVFYWLRDQNNILGQLFEVRYVKKKLKNKTYFVKKKTCNLDEKTE